MMILFYFKNSITLTDLIFSIEFHNTNRLRSATTKKVLNKNNHLSEFSLELIFTFTFQAFSTSISIWYRFLLSKIFTVLASYNVSAAHVAFYDYIAYVYKNKNFMTNYFISQLLSHFRFCSNFHCLNKSSIKIFDFNIIPFQKSKRFF